MSVTRLAGVQITKANQHLSSVNLARPEGNGERPNRNVAISHATQLLPLCVVHVGICLIVYLFDRSPISGRRPAKLSHRVANWEENGHRYSRKYTVANILFFLLPTLSARLAVETKVAPVSPRFHWK